MQSLALLLFSLCGLVLGNGEAELAVDTTYMPEHCPRLSAAGDKLTIHYTGSIDESSATGKAGKEFDSSRKRGQPFEFVLGQGRVIDGWEQGLVGMCVGERRTLVIPPALGYGNRGSKGSIPGGATLRFEVECMNIRDGGESRFSPQRNVFKEIDKDDDWLITIDELMEFHVRKFGNKPMPQGMWERFDKNRDGIVDWEEFDGPKGTEGPPSKDDKKEL